MRLKVQVVDMWAAEVEDRPGAMAKKLAALRQAGADLHFVLARRADDTPGTGVLFVAGLKGKRQTKAAEDQGFLLTHALHSLRVEGWNQSGAAATAAEALAKARVNVRGLAAAVSGRKFVAYIATDTARQASKAVKALRQVR